MTRIEELDLPPVDPGEFDQAVREPFRDPNISEGVSVSYPHTRQDEDFNRRISFAGQVAELNVAPDTHRISLARHQPRPKVRDINSYTTDVRPVVDKPRSARAFEGTTLSSIGPDALEDSRWKAFAEGGHQPNQNTRRGRAGKAIQRILRSGRA
jgi:hypothetical protein